MVRLSDYNLGRHSGSGSYAYKLKRDIVQNLESRNDALKVLEESIYDHYERWIVMSTLVRDNSHSPELFDLRYRYVQELKRMPQDDLSQLWRRIECNLNEEERKLWKGEGFNLAITLTLALLVVTAIGVSLELYSKTEFLEDETGYIFLGLYLIFCSLAALICLASYCFKRCKRRQSMRLTGSN